MIEKLIIVCKIYDEETTTESLTETFSIIGVSESMTERNFYHWVVLMYAADCSESEFMAGPHGFGMAAERVRGLTAP